MGNASENEYQELDLSQSADLLLFQASAKAVFSEAHSVGIKNNQIDKKSLLDLVEKNNRLRDLVHTCSVNYLPQQQEVPIEIIDELQLLYDDLITHRNDILQQHLDTVPVAGSQPEAVEKKVPVTLVQDEDDSFEADEEFPTSFERKRKTMSISYDADEMTQKSIAIKIAQDATQEIVQLEAQLLSLETEYDVSKLPPVVAEHISLTEKRVVGYTEAMDPINIVIDKPEQPTMAVPELARKSHQKVTNTTEPMTYKSFVQEQFGSMDNFGKVLNNEIARIESLTNDRFGGWLGEDKSSPFDMIQDMTVREVLVLQNQKGLREVLKEKNTSYETMLTWFDLLPEMVEMTDSTDTISFGELFTYWIIECELAQAKAQSV